MAVCKMLVPNATWAIIPPGKTTNYLLNDEHPDGGSKARFFKKRRFDEKSLSEALLNFLRENDFSEIIENQYGKKYVVDGVLPCPDGTTVIVRSIWVIKTSEFYPIFVTAYPLKK